MNGENLMIEIPSTTLSGDTNKIRKVPLNASLLTENVSGKWQIIRKSTPPKTRFSELSSLNLIGEDLMGETEATHLKRVVKESRRKMAGEWLWLTLPCFGR